MDTYEGGCHCGAVRFRVAVDRYEALECNCSMCRRKANLHLIVPREQFTLLAGAEVLRTYTFNTGVAKHTFCGVCGIHPFYAPRSHPDGIDVNIRCLDGDAAARFQVTPFDGADWEANVTTIR
ncbi:MAG: GFA family protein [Candidatus Binatia bacterium]